MQNTRELPILFSTPMVKANLEGRKTMTRRTKGLKYINENPNEWVWKNQKKQSINRLWDSTKEENPNPIETYFILTHKETGLEYKIKCPYGQPGDLLWVRETFRLCDDGIYAFKANYSTEILNSKFNKGVWKPSIHMPKTATRIWLKVTNVRVERLHDITEEDIIKEGVQIPCNNGNPVFLLGEDNSAVNYLPDGCLADNAPALTKMQLLFAHFAELWCKINGRESWDSNPWVWVIEYEILSTTGKPSAV